MTLKNKGFTLVEIMIVVAVLGLIAAIAIPNFVKAIDKSVQTACQANARQLQTAIETASLSSQAALPTKNLSEDAIKVVVYPDYLKSIPHCSRGTYYTDASSNVMCTVHNPSGPVTTASAGAVPGEGVIIAVSAMTEEVTR